MRALTASHALALLIIVAPLLTAQAKLDAPYDETWFVEGVLGVPIPTTSLSLGDAGTGLGASAVEAWTPRLLIQVAVGGRVWDPLALDVGARIGYSFQQFVMLGSHRRDYDPPINFVEIVPFAQGKLYPFDTESWGLTFEVGFGMLFAFGGKRGGTDFPEKGQMMIRIRTAFGAIWRWRDDMHFHFDVVSLTTDIPITTQFSDVVGTQLNFEPRAGFRYRF